MSAISAAAREIIRREVAELVLAAMGSGVAWLPDLISSGKMRPGDYTTTLDVVMAEPAASFMKHRGNIALDMAFADAEAAS